MKTLTSLILLVFTCVGVASAAVMPQRTPADVYAQSYASQMRSQAGYESAAQIRAGEYQNMYEGCDTAQPCTHTFGAAMVRQLERM